jgi:hypothetical protein
LVSIFLSFSTFSVAQYQTIGPGSCGLGQSNCHTNENTWWKDDAHHATVDAFYDDPQNYEKIAQLAGVGAANMLKGNQQCASCHGTVVSGKEARETEDGVTCESCHGPGSAYKDPHSEGDPKLGLNRPGRIKGMQLGMVELKNLDNRAKTCVRCHYITDQKLLAAGHPDGARFNYVSGLKKFAKHWKRPPAGDDLVRAPFEKAMNAKGPVAQIVKVETAPEPAPAAKTAEAPTPELSTNAAASPVIETPANSAAAVVRETPAKPATPPNTRTAPAAEVVSNTPKPIRQNEPTPPPPPTVVIAPAENVAPIDLPPFPVISDTASVQEILLILKKRLELLYQKTNGKPVESP